MKTGSRVDPSLEEIPFVSGQPVSEDQNEVGVDSHVVMMEEEKSVLPPDGGYGWIVVLASAVVHIIDGGLERSGGILYLELLERYHSSATLSAWVTSLGNGCMLCCGPVASAVTDKVGFRLVVFIGALVTTVGCVLSAFPPQLFYVHLTFGLLAGIGRGFCYTPSVVIVGMYFDKKRGMAVGLATAGVGVGSFVLPPLLRFLFDDLGYQGTFIILGGITLQLCVCAMLFRNPKWTKVSKPATMEANDKEKGIGAGGTRTNITHVQDSYGSIDEDGCKGTHKPESKHNTQNVNKDQDDETAFLSDSKYPQKKRRWLGLQLLKDPLFLAFCVTLGLMTVAFQSALTFLPALAQSKGVTKTESALLLSILGMTDTVTRIMCGIFFDANKIRPLRRYLYNCILFLLAAVTFFSPLAKSFASFVVISILVGILSGAYISQKSVIIADILGTEVLVASFGILVWFQGIGTLIGPPIAGQVTDTYHNYDLVFQFGGGIALIAGLILSVSNVYFFLQNRKAVRII